MKSHICVHISKEWSTFMIQPNTQHREAEQQENIPKPHRILNITIIIKNGSFHYVICFAFSLWKRMQLQTMLKVSWQNSTWNGNTQNPEIEMQCDSQTVSLAWLRKGFTDVSSNWLPLPQLENAHMLHDCIAFPRDCHLSKHI